MKVISQKKLEMSEILKFKSAVLFELRRMMDHEKGWVQQYHLGALRNVNSRMFPHAWSGHRIRRDR